MIEPIALFILCVIATEAITEIIVDSELFRPIKLWAFKEMPVDVQEMSAQQVLRLEYWIYFKSRIAYLVNCGYCSSVWVAGIISFLYMDKFSVELADTLKWLLLTFAIHRLSNWLHITYEYVKRGRVITVDLTHRGDFNTQDE